MEAQLQELTQFLRLETRVDVKIIALDYVLGLTGSEEGRSAITKQGTKILESILDLTTDKVNDVSHNAYLTVLNLSGYDSFTRQFIELKVIPRLIEMLLNTSAAVKDADTACMILSNLTRLDEGADSFITSIASSATTLYKLVDIFDKRDSVHGRPLHYLGSVFSNAAKLQSIRFLFLDKQVCILPRLLPYIQYKESVVARGGVVGLLRNLCFETSYHEWLLGPEIDLLPYLLLPLAGPEQFTDEENDSLPPDLQYLPNDKEREPDPDIRTMLLETLMKLCATKAGRAILRDSNAYLILRELDRSEGEGPVKEACQNVISILIADEPESGMENLQEVAIPEDVVKKLAERSSN